MRYFIIFLFQWLLAGAAQAGPEDILRLVLRSFPTQAAPNSSPTSSAISFPTPGIRQVGNRLDQVPVNSRPSDTDIANAYAFIMSELGYNKSLWLTCPQCIPERPVLPDQGLRSAKILLESDTLLSGEAAGHSSWGPLESISARTSEKIEIPTGVQTRHRASAISALADALGDLRGQPLSESEFREVLKTNLELLSSEPQNFSRFGLEKIAYDAADQTISFEAKVRGTSVEIAKLNISRYVDRLVGLVFGAGGVFMLQDNPATGDSDAQHSSESRRLLYEQLSTGWENCAPQSSLRCFLPRDNGTASLMYEMVWAEAILEKVKELN